MAEKKINYLSRDYAGVRTELLNFVKKYYPDLMTDFTDASIGTMLIELNAAVADMLSHHTDRMFNETQIEYAQQRKSILNMARTLGVKVPGLRPSLTIVDFSIKVPAFGDTFDKRYAPIIRFGAQVSGAGKIFETLEDIDFNSPFTAGGIPNRSIIPNFTSDGSLINYTITKRELVVNGKTAYFSKAINVSDVKPFLNIVLPEPNVLTVEQVITLENATNGIPTLEQFTNEDNSWYEVDSLAEDKIFIDDKTRASDNRSITPAKWKSISRKFVREYTDAGFCKLTFGSGTNDGGQLNELINNKSSFINTMALGEIPKAGTTMYVRYRIGGGSNSNIGSNTINKVGSINTVFSGPNQTIRNSVRSSLTVTNPIPALGGAESPSIEELRNLVKYNFASQNRSVTIKDYVAQLLKMPGKYGLAFRWSAEERSNKVVFNLIGLNSDGKLDNQSSSTLKENMSTWMADYRMINDYVEINDGKIVNLAVALSIFVDKTFNQSETVNNSIQKIKEYFNVKKWSMGQDIYLSDLVEAINNVPGVLNVTNIEIYNMVSGQYSINRSSQSVVEDQLPIPNPSGIFSSLAPEANQLNIDDFVIFGEPNGMFEIKFPERDIKVRVKTN
jgi:hypothetical protein